MPPAPRTTSSSLEFADFTALTGTGISRDAAMRIPTAANCATLLKGTVSQIRPERYRGAERIAAGTLIRQPDPSAPMEYTISWTVDDLIHYGEAFWVVIARDGIPTERNPKGLPVRARWIPRRYVQIDWSDNLLDYNAIDRLYINGTEVDPEDVIYFRHGHEGVLRNGNLALSAVSKLEEAAERLSAIDLPAGVLKNEGAELNDQEAMALVEAFSSARTQNNVAFLQGVSFETQQLDSRSLQLIEARANAATEVARIYNVPVQMVAASPTGNSTAMLYANVQQNFASFIKQSVAPYLQTLEQTLSQDTVTPLGNAVKFDVQSYLRSDPEASVAFVTDLVAAEVLTTDEARSFLGIPASGTANTLDQGVV